MWHVRERACFLRFCFKVFSPISFLIFAHNIFCFVFIMIFHVVFFLLAHTHTIGFRLSLCLYHERAHTHVLVYLRTRSNTFLLFAGDVHTICPFDFSTELDEVRAFMVSYSPSRVKLLHEACSTIHICAYVYTVHIAQIYSTKRGKKVCSSIYILYIQPVVERTLFRE